MIIARPRFLKFVGSPTKVTHFYWEQAKYLETTTDGLLSNGSMKSFIAKDTDEAAKHFSKVIGNMLRNHVCGPFDPKDFTFCIYESEINKGEFWPDCPSTYCHEYKPV